MEDISIRKIEKSDIPAILDIQSRITVHEGGKNTLEILEHQMNRPESVGFVVEWNGEVVGFLLGEVKTGDFGVEESFWIINFGVTPNHMGKGIGRSLAERAFDYCRERAISDVYSVVRWDAGDVLSFFKSVGFNRSNYINLKKKLQT